MVSTIVSLAWVAKRYPSVFPIGIFCSKVSSLGFRFGCFFGLIVEIVVVLVKNGKELCL